MNGVIGMTALLLDTGWTRGNAPSPRRFGRGAAVVDHQRHPRFSKFDAGQLTSSCRSSLPGGDVRRGTGEADAKGLTLDFLRRRRAVLVWWRFRVRQIVTNLDNAIGFTRAARCRSPHRDLPQGGSTQRLRLSVRTRARRPQNKWNAL
jgi:hypothetical protein